MSAICIMSRRAEARKENLAKSHHNLNEIAKAKEKYQYESYMSNINTLNQMKQIFSELQPTLEEKEMTETNEDL